jgi:hypothetical protein
VKITGYNTDDQRCFNAFAEHDEKRYEHSDYPKDREIGLSFGRFSSNPA